MVRLAIYFGIFSIACFVAALLKHGSAWWLWPAVSFGLVSASYLGLGARAFGKRADGSLHWFHTSLLLPYLIATWAVWYARRVIRRKPPWHEVAPGIWLSQKPFYNELPPTIEYVVDLTSEFPGVRMPAGVAYVTYPTLDYSAPAVNDIRAAVDWIGDRRGLIHCAMGRGRSATVAAALLIRRGLAADVESAEQMLKSARPGVALNAMQREAVRMAMQSPPK